MYIETKTKQIINIIILCFVVKKWIVVWAQIEYFALRFQEKNGGFDTCI